MHGCEYLTISVEDDTSGDEIDTILVETGRGIERKIDNHIIAGSDCIISLGDRLRGLKDEVDWEGIVLGAESRRKKFYIDLLTIVEILKT